MDQDLLPTVGMTTVTVVESSACPRSLPGYELIEEIGRGGMGVVYRARDTALDRDVAVKLLSEPYPAGSPSAQRFLTEARVTGQLQHPGIPAVHQVGTLADGRPFLAMKLIKGNTLAVILKQRPNLAADRGRLLAIFEAVCQAVGYAHSHRVIHRDLKPANVMVGAFGEVQVMDWGLAKVLGEETSAMAEALPAELTRAWTQGSATPETGSHTEPGSLVGTPAFIAPEQAVGQLERVNERADVFGLGALLAVILTGQPPYLGDRSESVRVQAVRGKLEDCFARLDASGAEPEQVALCKKCLAFEPADRPAHAGIVAQLITAYLASAQERLEQARVERAAVEVRAREESKRRRLVLSLALALVVLVIGAAFVGLWYARNQASREARNVYLEREVAAAMTEAETRRQELYRCIQDDRESADLQSDPKQWQRLLEFAEAAYKRADVLAGGDRDMLSPALGERLATLAGQLQMDEQDRRLALALDRIRLESSALANGQVRLEPAAPELARVFRDAGYDIARDSPDAFAARIRKSAIHLPLVAALDFWTLSVDDRELKEQLLEVARAADPDPWRDRFRRIDVWQDLSKLRALAAEVDCAHQTPQLLTALGRCLSAAGGDPTGLFRRALIHHPRDFWLYFELGLASKNHAEQAGAFRAALAVRPEAAVAHYNLGVIQQAERHADEAIACYQKAIDLEPKCTGAYNNLGLLLEEQNKSAEAIACYRKAIDNDPQQVAARLNLGSALQARGNLPEAVSHYERALEIDPKNVAGLNNLGTALRLQHQLDEAVDCFQKALKLDPNHAMAWCNLGHVLREQYKFKEALPAMRRGHELGSRQSGWSYPSSYWVVETARWIALDEELAALKRGEAMPGSAQEWLALAKFCAAQKKRYATAARCYASAFSAEPKLAEELDAALRYDAACSAARAASGQGEDAAILDDKEKTRLRQQALDWLRADLAQRTKQVRSDKPADRAAVQLALRHWQQDADLACIRDEATLGKLPADEQKAFSKFWADVAVVLKEAEGKMN